MSAKKPRAARPGRLRDADLSSLDGRKAALLAVERSDLAAALKAALIAALDAGRFPPLAKGPKGRPPHPLWKQLQKSIRGMLIDRNAPRGHQTAEIKRLAKERNISPAAMRDEIFRPNRKPKKP